MNFIALTLEQAKEIAHSHKIKLEFNFIRGDSDQHVDRWRVVKQVEDKGVTILYLMVEA